MGEQKRQLIRHLWMYLDFSPPDGIRPICPPPMSVPADARERTGTVLLAWRSFGSERLCRFIDLSQATAFCFCRPVDGGSNDFKLRLQMMMRLKRSLCRPLPCMAMLAWLVVALAVANTGCAEPWTLELELDGRSVAGKPLRWSPNRVVLLGRDGTVWRFPPSKAKNFRKVPGEFQPYNYVEMRGRLLDEFRNGLEVSATAHYFVVHPPGQADKWTKRFEELYRNFVLYFDVRDIPLESPTVPLVAVVFPNQAAYLNYARQTERGVSSQTLGYYSLTSNRIIMFDSVGTEATDREWQQNAETIVHEAVHQAAFNTGVHDRATLPPRWVVEGLGTMFEARGVWDSRKYPRLVDRLHRQQLLAFQRNRKSRPSGLLPRMLADDRLFQTNPQQAYAEAWAFTFFLVETEPGRYSQYVRLTTSADRSLTPTRLDRLREFTAVFGTDLQQLEAHYLNYMDRLLAD